MSGPVLYALADGIAEIRFNRPEVLNALDQATSEALIAAIDRALADPAVRVILFSGAGRAFMAGGDLAAFRRARNPGDPIAELIGPLHAALLRLAEAPKISIAAAQGPVAGAGMSFFLGADLGILAAQLVAEAESLVHLAGQPDFREGLEAFFERRAPKFR